jgi:predicted phosphodiesterase
MRVFALSDIHVDYDVNGTWVQELSRSDYLDDILILAGDVSHSIARLQRCLNGLVARFKKVLFVPGNHDLWVTPEDCCRDSLEKFDLLRRVAEQSGSSMAPYHHGGLSIVPLFGWYDFSFGVPDQELQRTWMDFQVCRWPPLWSMADVTSHFLTMNKYERISETETILSFSHFLPRADVMPRIGLGGGKRLLPVLGTTGLERNVRKLRSAIHIYGHSHLNRRVLHDGTFYVNNAYGYPHETHLSSKELRCVYISG